MTLCLRRHDFEGADQQWIVQCVHEVPHEGGLVHVRVHCDVFSISQQRAEPLAALGVVVRSDHDSRRWRLVVHGRGSGRIIR